MRLFFMLDTPWLVIAEFISFITHLLSEMEFKCGQGPPK